MRLHAHWDHMGGIDLFPEARSKESLLHAHGFERRLKGRHALRARKPRP
jgi:metal-dependent hydrolase (beta-lactamase superfamily II)